MKDVAPQQVVNLTHDFKTWHSYQGTSNDCGPYCVTMVSNGLYRAPLVSAAALAEELSHRGLPDRIPGWATLPWGVVGALRRLGLQARWRFGMSFQHLFDNLRGDVTTIVIIGEPLRFRNRKWAGWSHYKVLVTWDPGRGLGFVDPGVRYPPGMSWQDLAEFRREWNWMGRQLVEVRRS
jgi:hypothetical protein